MTQLGGRKVLRLGPIRRDEITGMMDMGRGPQRCLTVMVVGPRAVQARQGIVKCLLLFFLTQGRPSPVNLWAHMPPEPHDVILSRIAWQIERIAAHNPKSPVCDLVQAGPSVLIRDDNA